MRSSGYQLPALFKSIEMSENYAIVLRASIEIPLAPKRLADHRSASSCSASGGSRERIGIMRLTVDMVLFMPDRKIELAAWFDQAMEAERLDQYDRALALYQKILACAP